MEDNLKLYQDIANRTDGDIYVGVVGPVRTGKSTFIKNFMDLLVIPNINNEYKRERARDELPQSAAGKTIMTTEPKFIPNEAVEITVGDNLKLKTRLVYCVGYLVNNAIGYLEDDMPRMVKTPWSEEEIPFEKAAEIGTKKVIEEHSTIGILVTTDGSITEIPREDYVEAEERVVKELKELNKPFVIVLNTNNPYSDYTKELYTNIKEAFKNTNAVKNINVGIERINSTEIVKQTTIKEINLGNGSVSLEITLQEELFYQVLTEITGVDVQNEADLFSTISNLASVKKEYDKVAIALEEVKQKGYGIVTPTMEELILDEPEMVKQGSRFGVKLKAKAPSIHMIQANIETEVSPIVGSEKQSEDLVNYLLSEFENDPKKIWESNIFGKSLHELVNEGLQNKLSKMPEEAQGKLQETLERIVNEGSGGLICIIL